MICKNNSPGSTWWVTSCPFRPPLRDSSMDEERRRTCLPLQAALHCWTLAHHHRPPNGQFDTNCWKDKSILCERRNYFPRTRPAFFSFTVPLLCPHFSVASHPLIWASPSIYPIQHVHYQPQQQRWTRLNTVSPPTSTSWLCHCSPTPLPTPRVPRSPGPTLRPLLPRAHFKTSAPQGPLQYPHPSPSSSPQQFLCHLNQNKTICTMQPHRQTFPELIN